LKAANVIVQGNKVRPGTLQMRPIRVLVIGAGGAAVAMHLPVLARLRDMGEVVLSLICDIQSERAAAARREFGFLEQSGDGVAALERQDIDAVYIFGSAQLHYEYGLAALRNGKHLFVEKPIAPSYLEAHDLAQTAHAQGLIAVGGLNRRFHQSLAAVRAHAGRTGWRFAEAVFHKPEFGKPPLFGARTWLGANGIHGLDALLFMMGGLPEHLTALAGETSTTVPSTFSALMRWRDGGQGVFLCDNSAGSRREEYVFHGLGETYRIDDAGLTVEKGNTVVKTAFPSVGDGVTAEHESFLQAIQSGAEPPHSLAAIGPSLFLAELIEEGFSGQVQLPQSTPVGARRAAVPGVGDSAAKSILVAPSVELQPSLARLLPQYRLVSFEDVRGSSGERPDIAAAILGRGSSPLPPEILAKLPRLGVVGIMALSLARHEPEALLARGITLLNASSAYAESVAEFALGLAILGRRRAFISHQVMRAGGWGTAPKVPGFKGLVKRAALNVRPAVKALGFESFLLGIWRAARPLIEVPGPRAVVARDLQGATVGLIGWGANARAFAERLARAGSRVLVYSEHAAVDDIRNASATPASLAEVLAADIVSLHRGLNESTRHSLGAAELAKLRAGTVLINVARGALIEPAALLARLKQGDIFACLDTYDEEPLIASHPLRRLPNVFLTSHIAGGSPDMHAAAATEVVEKVAAYLAGDTVRSVSAERLRTMT
jgi:phosphoglycerate dehydrogenase-like enzyme/predicted dehydrogenase